MKTKKPNPKYSVAELFCGCGGFSHGFWRTGRFETALGNDVKKFALETFRLNHTHGAHEPAVIEQDIRTVPDSEIIKLLKTKGVENLDVLLGGPPCQGFSQMRRTEGRRDSKVVRFGGYNKLDQDPRNDLVLRFLEIAAALNPKVVVIENVPQFLSHYHDGKRGGIAQQVEEVLGELGYEVACGILNAADYGVPQLRQRAVIIASRLGKITLPMPSHGERELVAGRGTQPWVTVDDALGDLPVNPHLHDTLAGHGGFLHGWGINRGILLFASLGDGYERSWHHKNLRGLTDACFHVASASPSGYSSWCGGPFPALEWRCGCAPGCCLLWRSHPVAGAGILLFPNTV